MTRTAARQMPAGLTREQQGIWRTYRGAGESLASFVQEASSDVMALALQLDDSGRLRDQWRNTIEQYRQNYRAARAQWNQTLSDGSPSWGSRLEAARLMKRTAVQAAQALRELDANAQTVPAALRIATAMGLGGHIRALSAAAEGAAAAAGAVFGGGAFILLAVALLMFGGKGDK